MKLIITLIFICTLFSQEKTIQHRQKDLVTNGEIHANNVRAIVANNGWLFWGGGASGLIVPSSVFDHNPGNFATVFAGGIWFVGNVNGETRAAIGSYATDFIPGDWNEYHVNPIANGRDNDKYKVYYHYSESHIEYLNSLLDDTDPTNDKRIHKFAEAEIVKALTNNQEWDQAVLQGAPLIPPGDVAAFYIYHDAHKPHREENGLNESKTPLNLQVRQLVYQFRYDDPIGNTVYVRTDFLNRNNVPIEGLHATIFMDSDLGQYQDDLVGTDVESNMMYTYNGPPDDAHYTDILGLAPPALGLIFNQGSVIDSIGHQIYKLKGHENYSNEPKLDQDNVDYEIIANKYVLPLSGTFYYNGGEEPTNADQYHQFAHNRFRTGGFNAAQSAALISGIVDSASVNWIFTGDPQSGTGWLDRNPDDRRIIMNQSKFDLGVSNGQENIYDPGFNSISFSLLTSFGSTNLASVSKLKFEAHNIITFFDKGFSDDRIINVPADADYQAFNHEQIRFSWRPVEEIDKTNDNLNPTEFNNPSEYNFQGYQLVQFTDLTKQEFVEVVVFDLIDGIKGIANVFHESNTLDNFRRIVIKGKDSGVKYSYLINKDYVKDDFLRDNNYYHFGLRAYYYNPNPVDEVNFVKFGAWSEGLDSIMPKKIELGTEFYSSDSEDIDVNYSNSKSDGKAFVSLYNPYDVTGSSYKIKFKKFESNTYHFGFLNDTLKDTIPSGTLGWYLEKDNIQISKLMPQSADGSEHNFDIYQDGLRIIVTGPDPTFKDFRVTANANGPLAEHAGFAADYNHWPGLGRTNIGLQQANGSMWFFGPWHSYGAQSFYNAMPVLDALGNLKNYVPHDFEWRFTGNGKAFNNWTAPYNVIDAPFEIWDIGILEGTEDDVKLIPYIYEENDNDIWDYGASDNPMSGGSNDPEMERIYWMAPTDYSPGTSGFDSFMADVTTDPNNAYPFNGAQNILSGTSFIWWNGWDVTQGHPNDNLSIIGPEIGTMMKFVTSKVNTTETEFTFTSPQAPKINDPKLAENQLKENVTVFPNPYYGVHSNQANRWDTHITFANLPVIENNDEVVIKIYMINGELVKTLKYDGTSTVIKWDVANDTGRKVRSNLYIAVIKYRSTTVIKKILYFAQEDYYRTH